MMITPHNTAQILGDGLRKISFIKCQEWKRDPSEQTKQRYKWNLRKF